MAAHFSLYAAGGRLVGVYLCRITEKGWIVEQSWERLPPHARSPAGAQDRQAFPIFFWETENISAVM
jgi:hypothetical protein